MYLIVKLRFGFLFKYFPQHEALYSYIEVIPEIPQTAHLQFRPNPTSSGLEVEAKFTFKINIPTVNVPAPTNKVFIFKLTIDDCFRNHSNFIGSKFLPLALITSVAFFWDTQ